MYDVDLFGDLPTQKGGAGEKWLANRHGVVIHYNGPEVAWGVDEREYIEMVNQHHLNRDWSAHPGSGRPILGDGIMYHFVVGRQGTIYRTRHKYDVLWHCGSWPENRTYWSVLVILGGRQKATVEQLGALYRLVDTMRTDDDFRTTAVIGHQEVDWTSCPGTLMDEFVLPYRDEAKMATEGMYFAETECFVGGAFWDYWRNRGGLMIFGYPLTDEIEEDGMTVQYFERAVFEWHPGNEERHRVLLRRLGAAALHNSEIRV